MSLNIISYLTLFLYALSVWGYCRSFQSIKMSSKGWSPSREWTSDASLDAQMNIGQMNLEQLNLGQPNLTQIYSTTHQQQKPSTKITQHVILLIITAIALSLHGYTLYRWIDTAHGQNLNWANVLSLVCWFIACLTLIVSLKKPLENLMILILPVTASTVPLVYLFSTPEFYRTGSHPGQLFHILCSIVSVGILGLAGFQALMLHMQNQALRNKPSSAILRLLPPIETMEKLLFQIIFLGFLCLSLALVSALLFASDPYARSHLHKIGLSFIAWAFFAILLYKHYRAGWRGKTAIRWTLGGVIALLVAYFSSKLILLNVGLN